MYACPEPQSDTCRFVSCRGNNVCFVNVCTPKQIFYSTRGISISGTMEQAKELIRNWTWGPLHLSWLGLTELPELPEGLRSLYCQGNLLTRLPDTLPAGLRAFHCYGNNLPAMEDDESIPDYVARVNAIAEAASQERIIQRCAVFFEELAQKVWHPSRVERLMLAGVDMEEM